MASVLTQPVQRRRNKTAAKKFFRKLLKGIVNLSRLMPSSGKRVYYLVPSYPLGSPLRTRDLSPTFESMAHFLTVCRG
jgi:hypothetical protein